ncbi:MAG TPA: hypothetical protein VHW23_03970 [Kofleriaceae bacterium]|nr:hypothetical protein [Kofleriaceae bacterium]
MMAGAALDPKQIADRVTRAVAAAGATPWLVGYDANAIQELITASGRPISMRGASEAIRAFDDEVNKDELSIFGGGGRGVVLARSRDEAERQQDALVDRYRAVTRGGVVATCAVPLERGGHAEAQSIRWLRHRLELAKDAALPPAGELPDAKQSECAYCRAYRGSRPRKRDEQIELVCAQCDAMLDRGRLEGRDPGDRFGEMSQSIADIATEGWLAVVSADGNNLGALFEALGSLVELAVVSSVIAASFRDAHERAIAPIPEAKRVTLMTGGDDVRAFLPPGEVLRYVPALVETLESEAARHVRATGGLLSKDVNDRLGKLGIGIGAVIAHVYYPASRLVEYAHQLEDSAKAACRRHDWRSGFDFAVVTTEDTMVGRPVRSTDRAALRPLAPCTEPWQAALRSADALSRIPSAQLTVLAAAPTADGEATFASTKDGARPEDAEGGELGNLLRYQVARSEAWRAWYDACGVDWRDPRAVFARRPTRDALELARLLGFQERSR